MQLMGSLFEQGLLLLLDTVVLRLAAARGASAQELFARHANLE
jgi:6-phospho-3-hexuloisomerase